MKRLCLIITMLIVSFSAINTVNAQHFSTVWSGNPYQPMTFVISAASLDGSGLGAGDEIAVFDVDGGSEICVGVTVLTGPIGGSPLTITASADDPLTTGTKDGFTDGNAIIYRYWDNSAGVEIVCVTPTYTPGYNEVYTSLGTMVGSLAGITSPTANAGSDDDMCETDTYTLSGSATNYSSVGWTTSGDGTFDDANILGATYTPGSGDLSAGSVTLTLTAYAIAPCTDDATDDVVLSIVDAPTANAGTDATICETDTYTLSGSATNQTSVAWSTSGTGTFDDNTLLGATYTPSAADISGGSVVLTLTAYATAPCTDATDDMTLSFQLAPTADAGSDANICETDTYTLSGAATNQTSVAWSSSGTGTFDDNTLLGATYTPSAADISGGSVVLTLTAYATAPCTDATDNMTLSFQLAPTADAGLDATICETDTYTLSGSATNQTSVAWSSSGTGTFDDNNLLGATYTPSAADISGGSVVLTLTAYATAPCTDVTDNMTLSFTLAPTADAGTDATICETDTYALSGAATNQTSVLWSTAGDGTFDDDTQLDATYTPGSGDISAGSVVLTLTAYATAPCTDATDDMTLSFQLAPTADAGSDANICETDTYTLSGAATNQTSVLWSTAGDGTFDDDTQLDATYTPGSGDISAGSVVLTLTAYATAPCTDATDNMTLSFQLSPTADAGTDATICSTDTYTLSGSAANQTSVLWTTAGDGTFDDDTQLDATYTPGSGDIAAGTVTLTLTAYANAPCAVDATDDIIITIQSAPTADAGTDASICSTDTYTLSGSAANHTSVLWTTAGDGTFDDDTQLDATYTPGSGDLSAGTVTLTLTAYATAPCAVDATDDMTITIQAAPTAGAGTDANICSTETYTLSGTAANHTSVLWTTAGDGTFDDDTQLDATYTPGSGDIAAGTVTLTLTAYATAPCAVDATDDMTITIQAAPTANAGTDASICSNETYTLAGAAGNHTSVLWTSAGDGTFDDDTQLDATYTPGSGDLSAGTVTLTLTAYATAPCAVDATDDITITIQAEATADAGLDATICETDIYTLSGSATNQTSVEWTTSGTGTFDDNTLLGATYTPSAADIAGGSVTLTLTAFATLPCSDAADAMVLTFELSPTADAGSDATICETESYTLSGAATNQTSVAWTTSGTGTFDDNSLLGATYTPSPADIAGGSVTLTLTAYASVPCVDATDDMVLSFELAPTADAGTDASICETGTYTLSGTAANYTSVLWTTAGDGTFDDDTQLDATYTPGAGDISGGTVTLTLTAYANAPCAVDATDDIVITILGTPTADAGSDGSICSTDTYTLSGAATNQTSVLWTTAGDGTFDDDTQLDATYTPGSGDIAAGTVTLTLTAYAASPCVDATDDMVITIQPAPIADAGADASICEDGDYTLSGSASNHTSSLWTTAGDGTFDDDTQLDATYTPGSGDIAAGTVTLTLTAYAVAPCAADATDDMVITIQLLPAAFAGADDAVCSGSDYTLSGSANNQFSIGWTTAGDGTFDDPLLLAATYTPGTNDIANGSVVLTLTATSVAPCSGDATDDMTLSIQAEATSDAGPDDVVAAGSDYTLAGSATNQASVLWTTAGDGTFDDASLLNATYTPGTGDLDYGSVVLTLTATATAPCTTPASDDMTLYFSFTQSINLTLGWNIMSFYVMPADMDMQNIVQPLIDNTTLIKVQDEDGNFVQDLPGPGWTNTIGDMANTEGYYIKVNANTNLDADGTYVDFPFDVDLSTGWNMAGYPVKVSQDAMTLLDALITGGTLVKVMNEAGNFIQNIPPYGWLNTIGNFDPDEGYYVNVVSDDVLTYQRPTKASTPANLPVVPPTQHFFSLDGNPFSPMNIVVQNITADGFQVEDGDELAVYDGELEVGSAVIHQGYGGYQVIIAAGDDPATEDVDGYAAGNTITFRYWDKSYDMVYENIQVKHFYGEKDFAGLGTFVGDLEISALGVSEYDQSAPAFLGQNYPNPFSNNTTINYGIYEDGAVLLSVFDVSGRRIHILEDANRSRGRYTITFENAHLEPGVYYYQLEFNSNGKVWSETRKMIVH